LFKIDGNKVNEVSEVTTNGQKATIGTFFKWFHSINLSGNVVTVVGVPLPITVTLNDWEGNLISRDEDIIVSAYGKDCQVEVIVSLANGQATYNFVSEIPGKFKLFAATSYPCNVGALEVIVNA
jgi:hypothetical protein